MGIHLGVRVDILSDWHTSMLAWVRAWVNLLPVLPWRTFRILSCRPQAMPWLCGVCQGVWDGCGMQFGLSVYILSES